MIEHKDIRPAGAAGVLYPADRLILERDISLLLENSPLYSFPSPIRGMLVPHAALEFSGGVAARAYRQIIWKKYDVTVILSASFGESYDFASIYPGNAMQTPLGEIAIQQEIAGELVHFVSKIRYSDLGYASNEHGVEVHLPFLKWMQYTSPVLPIMMGTQSVEMIETIIQALSIVLANRNYLIIASANLSQHRPEEEARMLDYAATDCIKKFSPERLWEDIQNDRCEMSGYGPAIAMMKTVRKGGAKNSRFLLYRNSGDINGSKEKVVGYASGVFY